MVSSERVEKDFYYPKVLLKVFSFELEMHFFVPLCVSLSSIVYCYVLVHSWCRGSEFCGRLGSVERYYGEFGVWAKKSN